jgi:hypothetical protein
MTAPHKMALRRPIFRREIFPREAPGRRSTPSLSSKHPNIEFAFKDSREFSALADLIHSTEGAFSESAALQKGPPQYWCH